MPWTRKEYNKKWNQKNPEKVRRTLRKWLDRNPDYYDKYNHTVKGLFARVRAQAKKKGKEFNLELETFSLTIQQKCFVTECTREVTGLDRVDNSKGYIAGNIRASCRRHNEIRNDMTDNECYRLCKQYLSWFEKRGT